MKNQIHFLTSEQDIPVPTTGEYIISLDGKEIDTFEKYIDFIEKKLSFPRSCAHMFDRYMDWIRDLTWFDYESYTIIIKSYSCFMGKSDYKLKCLVMNAFQNEILPFWEYEVTRNVIGGMPHSFNVYLIEA